MKNLTFLVLTHMPMPKHLKSFVKKKGIKVYVIISIWWKIKLFKEFLEQKTVYKFLDGSLRSKTKMPVTLRLEY